MTSVKLLPWIVLLGLLLFNTVTGNSPTRGSRDTGKPHAACVVQQETGDCL